MKLDKSRFSCWEDIDEDYDILFDDELIISIKEDERSIDVADYILQNQKLREEIVELADLWDGKESEKYGEQLYGILDKLGIEDVPYFWSKEGMDEMVKKSENKGGKE